MALKEAAALSGRQRRRHAGERQPCEATQLDRVSRGRHIEDGVGQHRPDEVCEILGVWGSSGLREYRIG